ncbi:type I-B CRISPR-associated protein Cas7/Csh2 [Methanobrevibacter sp.]|uniref:type I-B CRISPR-associated protein Cas7/Csh2 n=1 Tax=Methanobrevibacter sp. TaxID=66852 RepID=UPI00260BC1E7|nr:type I-B CRISPR-associated protein Cas7/Csh2 [uncultured Methanobrevibacter sp.]
MNRSEILFLYDIADANPNGDPLDDNKPRLDEETEINIVTDVRLKRTIRDYLAEYKNQELFVKEVKDDEGIIQDAKLRAEDYLDKKDDEKGYSNIQEAKNSMKTNILEKCIDVRLFGATIPLDVKIGKKKQTGSITLTGPVQFRLGRSLHKVEINHIKGTGAFASGKGKSQATFREEYILPYSLIGFYGIVNEKAAKSTYLTDEDVNLLIDGIWNGTKNLISRSKFGQVPRLLIQIEYNEENYFIGDLDKQVSLTHNLDNDKQIRSINDYELNIDNILTLIDENKDKINKIHVKIDSNLKFENIEDLKSEIENLSVDVEEITL